MFDTGHESSFQTIHYIQSVLASMHSTNIAIGTDRICYSVIVLILLLLSSNTSVDINMNLKTDNRIL